MRDELDADDYQEHRDGDLRESVGYFAENLGARLAEQAAQNIDDYLIPEQVSADYHGGDTADFQHACGSDLFKARIGAHVLRHTV